MSRDYLIIEQFLIDALQARALQAAFDLQIIDALADIDEMSVDGLLRGRNCDFRGGQFLLQMLAQNDVVATAAAGGQRFRDGDSVRLTDVFRRALPFRDLLTTKLEFSTLVAADYFANLPNLLRSEDEFTASSKLFELFDYGRCLDITTANCMHAARWMQLTTMLTRYEARVCAESYDFARHSQMLDVGGNSGEFSLQICRRHANLTAQVVDLPVVCHVGARHIGGTCEVDRISFSPGNMLEDTFPQGCDLITWKSVLHDWPDDVLPILLQKSYAALPPGGRLVIFERQRWDFSHEVTPYGLLPVMLFFRSYRSPEHYVQVLADCGFVDVHVEKLQLEVPFLLITAAKAG
ncbi:MAG: methyltransferase [Fuerstiella sp.]|nr:methyltransferase [Fuerstiella sp.]